MDSEILENASKVSKELNWNPDETFESGIRKTVEWYLENTAWGEPAEIHNINPQKEGGIS